ncbi:MAG: hypothetical protein COB08_003250 [Rhodobacteraceae bacterium]|nr:hypothetical protein [Paracoccaceae bacterium]
MRPKTSDIIAAVGAHYGVSKNDIDSDRREASLVHARHVCFWLTKELTLLSFPQIGMAMHRDHTTVMHGVQMIETKRHLDEVLQGELYELIGRMDSMVPPLAEFVEQLKFVSPEILADKLQHAVRITGGFWTPPQGKYGDHLFVIDLMGVNACGLDQEEACHNWRDIAQRVAKAQAA